MSTGAGGLSGGRLGRGVDVVEWDGWLQLDEHEITLGEAAGRERIKVVPRQDMLDRARSHTRLAG